MNLTDYIGSIGTRKFAERHELSFRTAEAYRQGRRKPRPELAEAIIRTSPVTWEGIYRPGGESRATVRRALRSIR